MATATPLPDIGEPLPRIDAQLKVTGKALYAADIPVAHVAHAVLVTSSIARGNVATIDAGEARALAGVLAIFTHDDLHGELEAPKFGNMAASSIAPLDGPEVFHDGQPVAFVVAETGEAALDAASRVRVTYRTQAASASFDDPGTETVAAAGASKQFAEDVKAGDFQAAFDAAPVTIEQNYTTPTQHHNPIELFSTTASWDGDHLTVYEPSQNVNGWKVELARQLRISPNQVRIVSPLVGGAFGSKGPMTSRTAIVAWAARKLNRPVRCVVSRMQAFGTQTYRAETWHRIRMGASPGGRIQAFGHEGWEVTSRPDPYVVGGTETSGRIYDYGAVLTKVSLVKADRNTPGYMRSPPELPYVYALENAMDEMAARLGMDPVEFRRANDTAVEPIGRKPFSSRSLMECYDRAARSFGWAQRDPQVRSMRDGEWLVGMGCATAIYPTNVGVCTARLRLEADGTLTILCASHEIGTGVRTVAAQMASEQLGIAMDRIRVEMGDSDLPPAPVSGGSNSTASVCSTVMLACAGLKEKLFTALTMAETPFKGAGIASLELRNGMITASGGTAMPLQDAMASAGLGALEEYTEFTPLGLGPDAVHKLYGGQTQLQSGTKGDTVKFAFGAEFVEVRVHTRTMEIRVPRIVGAFAAGRIMNARTARNQLMGGMVWGISSALHEATEIDRRYARYVNRDLQDYLVPVNADIQTLEVIFIPEEDSEVNPAGVKGLGELGNVGTAAAIASALYHATGRRFRELPIRIDQLHV